MNMTTDFRPSVPALSLSEEPSLRQRTEAAFRESATELLALLDELPQRAKKDALYHLRVQQIAFEVQNEVLLQMLAAKTVDGHFPLCACGGACTTLPS